MRWHVVIGRRWESAHTRRNEAAEVDAVLPKEPQPLPPSLQTAIMHKLPARWFARLGMRSLVRSDVACVALLASVVFVLQVRWLHLAAAVNSDEGV